MSLLIIVTIFLIQLRIINRLNFDSFTARFYKINLIKCLIDCPFKINNTWASFHNDVTKIKETLKRNFFPPFLIDKITKSYLDKVNSNSDQSNPVSDKTRFYKLPYIGKYSEQVQKSCQKSVNSSAKILILKLLLLLLKLITISQLKTEHPIF